MDRIPTRLELIKKLEAIHQQHLRIAQHIRDLSIENYNLKVALMAQENEINEYIDTILHLNPNYFKNADKT